jgi:hypothetical protein
MLVSSPACFVNISNCFFACVDQACTTSDGALALAMMSKVKSRLGVCPSHVDQPDIQITDIFNRGCKTLLNAAALAQKQQSRGPVGKAPRLAWTHGEEGLGPPQSLQVGRNQQQPRVLPHALSAVF